MNAVLYKYKGLKNILNKEIKDGVKAVCCLKQSESVINPSLIFALENSRILDYNYLYLQELKRYYFVESIDIMKNNVFCFNLKEDVLMSFKDSILNAECIITKSENPNSDFVNCNISQNETVTEISIDDKFNHNGNLILVTSIGGE